MYIILQYCKNPKKYHGTISIQCNKILVSTDYTLQSCGDAHTNGNPTALGTGTCSLTVAHRATTCTRYFQVLYKHGLRPIVSWCSMQFLWRSLRNFIYCISHIYLYIETAKNSIMLFQICTYEDLQTV